MTFTFLHEKYVKKNQRNSWIGPVKYTNPMGIRGIFMCLLKSCAHNDSEHVTVVYSIYLIQYPPPRNLTCPLKKDDFTRKFHLPTINFQGMLVVKRVHLYRAHL